MRKSQIAFFLSFFLFPGFLFSQKSIAREWNEIILEGIRADFARPTVHARNLFHISTAMYDAWAAYEPTADTYFLGKSVHGFETPFIGVITPDERKKAQEEAISFAAYRLIKHRFANAPAPDGAIYFIAVENFMNSLGYKVGNTSLDYRCGAAELGNYIAAKVIEYGFQDGSNEVEDYENLFYEPSNPELVVALSGNPNFEDLNRWQPLRFTTFVDQSGNPLGTVTPDFLSPEWGAVQPFSLEEKDITTYERDGHTYSVYYDPGDPALLDVDSMTTSSEAYIWGHSLVSIWASHHDPSDGVMMDICPASIGNNAFYPTEIAELPNFYNLFQGGDQSQGRAVNPSTNTDYAPQIVPRGDYARVLAEFWADGPDSETPPGHWFVLLNYVMDQPAFERKFKGQGTPLDALEWDVKAYFALGGAMHDAAIAAWSIKGWYDSSRPITAIRGMAELGQSSDPSKPNYHPAGLPLIPGYIEQIQVGDPLAGTANQFVNKIKLWTWRGPNFIASPATDMAGVGWILAADWYPYQRPTFVSPPFGGYISGHSTYSRAAAEVLTAITGDAYFPGGMGEFVCLKNQFLVFEEGPSETIRLQWATYQDASDQCSLSRIWGGIHPPMDDMPGRLIGEKLGKDAFAFAEQYFVKDSTVVVPPVSYALFPNPSSCYLQINMVRNTPLEIALHNSAGQLLLESTIEFVDNQCILNTEEFGKGIFFLSGYEEDGTRIFIEKIVLL